MIRVLKKSLSKTEATFSILTIGALLAPYLDTHLFLPRQKITQGLCVRLPCIVEFCSTSLKTIKSNGCCLAELSSLHVIFVQLHIVCFASIFINITALRKILMWSTFPIIAAGLASVDKSLCYITVWCKLAAIYFFFFFTSALLALVPKFRQWNITTIQSFAL